ncbi:MAG: Sua5/YciO/YrdC/YwlC family protein [Methylococcaceae bacterium]
MSAFKLRKAVSELKAGRVIAYPTEAVYGLGCDPLNANAVLHLLHLKKRPLHKGLILIGASLEQLQPYVELDDELIAKITARLHEPITWVVPTQAWVPNFLTGDHSSLAIRVTQHPLAKALCEAYNGAIVSTSANVNTKPSAKKAWQLRKSFARHKFFVLHGAVGQLQRETAIYDAVTNQRLR